MPLPGEVFERHWITSGHGVLWDVQGTYSRIDYSRLPRPPASLAKFDWLNQLPKRTYACTLRSPENRIGDLERIQGELESLGFRVPEDVRILLTRPEIQAQIPSCTCCYLELPDAVTPLPGYPGSFVMRFMNDSQCCVLWYLLFQPDVPVRILASEYFLEREIFDAMEYEKREGEPLAYSDVLAESFICAESFGEFIWRFSIENSIWYATHDKLPLAPVETSYLRRATGAEHG